MEKKLIDAYDHMTMPDDCARRIELRLQTELDGRKSGRYTKLISPVTHRRGSWAAIGACLLLILAVSGVVLNFWMTSAVVEVPTEQTADYSVATQFPAGRVEAFAAGVRRDLLEEDWESFAEKVQYPITVIARGLSSDTAVRELSVEGEGGMVGLFLRNEIKPDFLEEIRRETCTGMFCNWQGICMGNGQIWINEVDGDLKITAINGLFADAPDPQGLVLKRLPDGNYAVQEYAGQEQVVTIPAGTSEVVVTTIGTGKPVITHGDCVEAIWIPESVQEVQKEAFANCPALKSVYFEGDAPPEAYDVFEGSGNVYVYYRSGTEGWGDTWCGRETREYSHHVSLGTATLRDRIPSSFSDSKGTLAIEGYGATMWGENVQPKAFAVVDMDRDGVCELVLEPDNADGVNRSYLMLSDDGEGICGVTVWGRDIRKDGTFYSFSAKENARLQRRDAFGYIVESVDFRQQDKPLAQWHVYPCDGFDMVLESYRYASETGISTYPGNPYVYFEQLSYGEMGNDWNVIQQWLSREGVCIENKDMFYACDPDAPGCVFYGTLTGDGEARKISSMGYYVCNETGEKRAEVWDLDQPSPVYTVEVPPNDRGREVETAEEMLAYMDLTPYYGEIPRDAQKTAELLDWFVHRYAEHDVKGMAEYMADDAGEISSYPFGNDVYILTYGTLPDGAMQTGEKWHTTVELLEAGESGATYHLAVELIKQADGWKIRSYSIEKQ